MRGKPLDLSNGLKECPKCGQTKPLSEFHKSKATVHGFAVYCKTCNYMRHNSWRVENMDKAANNARKWRADNPERAKDHDLKNHLGLPLGTYDSMLKAQDGKCAICKSNKPNGKGRFHVDHCHDEGNVRGLLCSNCNLGIGHFLHDPSLLEAAIKYLSTAAPYQLPKRAVKRRG